MILRVPRQPRQGGNFFFRLFVIKEEEEETRLLYFSLFFIIIPLFTFFSPDDDNCAERFSFSFARFVALAISSKIAKKIRYIYIYIFRAHVVDKSHTTAGLKFLEQDDMR